jgi:hypothetical protein
MSQTSELRPDLCSDGHVLFITMFPPSLGGTCVIMGNLLSYFNPASVSVATLADYRASRLEFDHDIDVHVAMSSVAASKRLSRLWRRVQLPLATRRVIKLIEDSEPTVVVGVFPYYDMLKVARDAARATRTPWIAYLHDTLAESMSGSSMAQRAQTLQEQVFSEASSILVMSQGMVDLYREQYGLQCKALEHSYPETIPSTLPDSEDSGAAFWGGNVYDINRNSLARISRALGHNGTTLSLASSTSLKVLESFGIAGDHISATFYPQRQDYLDNLERQGFLILALDWPDESGMHPDELATIFPTKTPEYLASGRPILVHCPEDYFLARFFREHGCGLVVSERSDDLLRKSCKKLLSGEPDVLSMRQAALEAAGIFSRERISSLFRQEVEAVSRLEWGQQIGQ